MQKKSLIEIIAAIFIAAVFLSSYAAGGGNGSTTTTSTIVTNVQSFYANAKGSAAIQSFSPVLSINISCNNTANVSRELGNALIALERNGSVSNYISTPPNQVFVQAGNASSYTVFNSLSKSIDGSAACTGFYTSANIRLPSKMNFYLPTQKTHILILIPNAQQSGSLPIRFASNMSSAINVSVSALIAVNGSIYGNLSVREV